MDLIRSSHRLGILLVAALPLLACPAGARSWLGDDAVRLAIADGTLDVTLRPDAAGALRLTADGQNRWVFTGPTGDLVGESYSIELRNRSSERLKVVVGVDGLNVYGREKIAGSAYGDVGSILGPWEERTLPGWQLDDRRAQRFVFSPPEWSEGEGRTEAQIGELVVQVYREWRSDPWRGGALDRDRDRERPAPWSLPSESPSAQAPGAPRHEVAAPDAMAQSAPIGTTSGADVDNQVRTVRFVTATSYPEAWAVIDYGRTRAARWQRPVPPPAGDELLGLTLAPAADGTRIVCVERGSAAARAGLADGDVILRIDTTYGPSPAATRRILSSKDRGDYTFLRVRRGDGELALKIRV